MFFCLVVSGTIHYSCIKDKGKDPELAYGDKALLDSTKNESTFVYYKNSPSVIYPGSNGNSPHGSYKLKFNKKAFSLLTDNGKLPVNGRFEEGSFIVKEIVNGGSVTLYSFMYKHRGSWIWAEIEPSGTVLHSTNINHSVCTDCHKQSGNRDFAVSFNFY